MIKKTLKINGVERILILDKDETLVQVLRDHLLLTGCKIGCGEGHCGACNVIMNGKVTRSCIYKMSAFTPCQISCFDTFSCTSFMKYIWNFRFCIDCNLSTADCSTVTAFYISSLCQLIQLCAFPSFRKIPCRCAARLIPVI